MIRSHARRDVVLVVDDSPDTLTLINDTLEAAGMDVLVALEGKQALTITRRIRPDIILMDAVMPNMDGFETTRTLKREPGVEDIPVIFMTGLEGAEDIVRGLEAGGVDYLVKPVEPRELLARIKVHLANARVRRTAQTALDGAGQHLMTVNPLGRVTWATPQCHELLGRLSLDEGHVMESFEACLRTWLSQDPDFSAQLHIGHLGLPLSVRLLGHEPGGLSLLRLFDEQKLDSADVLKDELKLTERESEVLYWIAQGKTNREVAEILGMSPRTVNKHLEQIFPKLGVENRTAAAAIALRILERRQ